MFCTRNGSTNMMICIILLVLIESNKYISSFWQANMHDLSFNLDPKTTRATKIVTHSHLASIIVIARQSSHSGQYSTIPNGGLLIELYPQRNEGRFYPVFIRGYF